MPRDPFLGRARRAVLVVADVAGDMLASPLRRAANARTPQHPPRAPAQSEWERAQAERLRAASPPPARPEPTASPPPREAVERPSPGPEAGTPLAPTREAPPQRPFFPSPPADQDELAQPPARPDSHAPAHARHETRWAAPPARREPYVPKHARPGSLPIPPAPPPAEPVVSEPAPAEPVAPEPPPADAVVLEPEPADTIEPEPPTAQTVEDDPATAAEPVVSEPPPAEPVAPEPPVAEAVAPEPPADPPAAALPESEQAIERAMAQPPTSAEDDAQSEPAVADAPPPVRYDPGVARAPEPRRSPRRAGLHANLWLTGIVLAVLAVGATGYWALRVHQRIGQTTLEHQLGTREKAQTVRCSKLQADGAVWACGVFYKVESVCLIARVNVLGSWSTAIGQHRCQQVPELVALLPKQATGAGVASDVDRQLGGSFVCVKLPGHQVRWACQRASPADNVCKLVRVVDWTAWNEKDGGRLCSHLPQLRTLVKRAQA